GGARVHLFMRDDSGNLLRSTHPVAGADATWPEAWQPAGVPSPAAPVFAVAFDDRVVMARRDGASRVRIRLFDPSTTTWGAEVATSLPTEHAPRLVWDGTALNIFTQMQDRLHHSAATEPDLSDLSSLAQVGAGEQVRTDEFHAIPFN